MKKFLLPKFVFGAILVLVMHAAPAHAQATRTWVSSASGLDSNPCSRTAPCMTLAGAYSKTAIGGEISVIDAGGYGTLTVTHAITINGEGTLAGIIAASPTPIGINVAAAATDRVIIRNLSINGTGGGNAGINITSGKVTVDKVFIYGFTSGFGIILTATTSASLDVRDTNITNSSWGILMSTTGGFVTGSIDNVRINDIVNNGVTANSNGVFATVNRSVIKETGTAISTSGNGTINVDNSELSNNSTAVNAGGSGSTVRINNNAIYNNTTAFTISGGSTVASANNNKIGSNQGATVPNGSIAIQ